MPRTLGAASARKKAFREVLRAYMRKKKVDPHFYMVDLLANTDTKQVVVGHDTVIEVPAVSVDLKMQAAKELAQYLEPKLKSMELSGNALAPVVVEIVNYAGSHKGSSSA